MRRKIISLVFIILLLALGGLAAYRILDKKEPGTLEGIAARVSNNPEDINSQTMTAIIKDKEVIVVTNSIYVNTLGTFYLYRNVALKGSWRKDAIIFGRKYRVFWIEDIALAKR